MYDVFHYLPPCCQSPTASHSSVPSTPGSGSTAMDVLESNSSARRGGSAQASLPGQTQGGGTGASASPGGRAKVIKGFSILYRRSILFS